MHTLAQIHKDIPFNLVLWLPMAGLWAQAAVSALGLGRGGRRGTRKPVSQRPAPRFGPARPPRLVAPR
jgi:hypothetical protein